MTAGPTGLVLPDDSPARIARAIEENAIAGVEVWAEWPGLELHQEEGLTCLISDIPFFIFNSVLRCDSTLESIDNAIDRVINQAKSREVPRGWWLTSLSRPEDLAQRLEARGLIHVTELPAMAVDLLNLNESGSTPPGLSIDTVADDESLVAWNQVVASVNEFPDFAGDAWLAIYQHLGVGEHLPWVHFLARLEGEPVAACSLFLGNGVAGLHSVSTAAQVRRQGIGTAITLAALKHARGRGYRLGTLFSSEMAVEMYLKLGFREYSQGHLYVWEGGQPEVG